MRKPTTPFLPALCRAGATVPGATQLGLALGTAAAVTAARTALLAVWPEFKEASDRSNQQVAPCSFVSVCSCFCRSLASGRSDRQIGGGWLGGQHSAVSCRAGAGVHGNGSTPHGLRRPPTALHAAPCLHPAQVLGPLGAPDLLWVAALPAVSEELLFRGALIPAVYPDW